jgi:parallel beta-helix repeat protein
MDQGFNTVITNNTMDVDYYGIEARYGSYYSLNGNTITIK